VFFGDILYSIDVIIFELYVFFFIQTGRNRRCKYPLICLLLSLAVAAYYSWALSYSRYSQGYHSYGISGNLEMSGNSAKVREK